VADDELRAACERLRLHNESKPWEGRCTSPYAIVGDPSGRVLDVLNLHRDQGLLADAYLAEHPAPPPAGKLVEAFKALREAGGDAWDGIDDPEEYLGRRDRPPLTRERVAAAVRELFKTRNGASSGRVMELIRDDRLTIRQFTPSVMTDELCRLLGVDAIAAARPAGQTRGGVTPMRDCPECDGMGEFILRWPDGPTTSRPCKPCRGTGQVPDDFPPDADDLRDADEEPEPIEE
jgi:hypothetical protein